MDDSYFCITNNCNGGKGKFNYPNMELVHEDAAESHRRRKNADLKASVYKSLENSKASLSSNDDNAVMQNYQDKQMIIPISH